jgi:hypothetical protein
MISDTGPGQRRAPLSAWPNQPSSPMSASEPFTTTVGVPNRPSGRRPLINRLIEDGDRVVNDLGLAVRGSVRELLMVELLELAAARAQEVLIDIDGHRRLGTSGHDDVALGGYRVLRPGGDDGDRHREVSRLVAILQP